MADAIRILIQVSLEHYLDRRLQMASRNSLPGLSKGNSPLVQPAFEVLSAWFLSELVVLLLTQNCVPHHWVQGTSAVVQECSLEVALHSECT